MHMTVCVGLLAALVVAAVLSLLVVAVLSGVAVIVVSGAAVSEAAVGLGAKFIKITT
jgi:hypothetical protein